MKQFTLTIKSKTDYPDTEYTIEAESKADALLKFMRMLADGYREDIENLIEEENTLHDRP